jgi:hypothetical protein
MEGWTSREAQMSKRRTEIDGRTRRGSETEAQAQNDLTGPGTERQPSINIDLENCVYLCFKYTIEYYSLYPQGKI